MCLAADVDRHARNTTLDAAVATAYEGTRTLTVQAALRLGDAVHVQVYRDPDVPDPPSPVDLGSAYGRFAARVDFLPVKELTPDFSPSAMLLDLLGLPDTRLERPPEVGAGGELPKRLRLVLVGHFLCADVARLFGCRFLDRLRTPAALPSPWRLLKEHKRFKMTRGGTGPAWRSPPLEHVVVDGQVFAVEVQFVDTIEPFGRDSLDGLSGTFLGPGKRDP